MNSKILIVDDEEVVRETISLKLRAHGYTTKIAKNGQEALEILEQEEFDLIIADIRMPGIDGVELLQRVSKLYPEMAKIILTGYDDEHAFEYAFESVCTFKLAKPPGEEFMIIIKRALEIRLLNKKLENLNKHLVQEHAKDFMDTFGISKKDIVVDAEENELIFSLR